jgi:hypothetical protein
MAPAKPTVNIKNANSYYFSMTYLGSQVVVRDLRVPHFNDVESIKKPRAPFPFPEGALGFADWEMSMISYVPAPSSSARTPPFPPAMTAVVLAAIAMFAANAM